MSKICSYCGHSNNTDTADHCELCNEPFRRVPVARHSTSTQPWQQTNQSRNFTFQDSGPPQNIPPANHSTGERIIQEPPTRDAGATSVLRPTPLEGVITKVERNEEQPPTNHYKIMSIILLVILLSPLFLSIFIISIVLVIAFSIIRLQPLAQMFNPITWAIAIIELMEIFVLGRLRRADQLSVYRGIVRDDHHNLYNFYLWGLLRTGNLIEGHRVHLSGTWHIGDRRNTDERGTLEVAQGMDISTGSSITSNWGNPWRNIFYILLVLFFGLVGWAAMNSEKFTDITNSLF